MSAEHLTAVSRSTPAHLEHVLLDAETRLQRGDWNDGLRSVVQAIFVAATEGAGGLSDVELSRWTSRLYDAGALPEGLG